MNRKALWAIAIGVTVAVGAGQAYAGENEGKCTLATLKGQYLFTGSGTLLPPAVTSPTPTASAGFHIFNGDGTGSDFVTFSLNGIIQQAPSQIAITYTLNPDCTGTYSVPSAGLHFDIFVAVDGSQLSVIGTDPGAAGSFPLQFRVGSE